MVKMKVSLYGALHFMIETENYRMLSAQDYTWRESPLRSGRVCDRKDRTVAVGFHIFQMIYFIQLSRLIFCLYNLA